jgi:hypothetical protein
MNGSFKVCMILGSALLLGAPEISAETPAEFLKNAKSELNSWRDEAVSSLAAYRDSIMLEFSTWVKEPWEPAPIKAPIDPPHEQDPPVPPIVVKPDDPEPIAEDEPITPNPVVAPPAPKQDPTPPTPVLPPTPTPVKESFSFKSYGTTYNVDASSRLKGAFSNLSVSQAGIAQVINLMDNDDFEQLSSSMLKCRDSHNLSDWAYWKLTGHFAKAFLPGKVNEQKVLQGLLMLAGGYDVRFGGSQSANRLYLFVNCKELVLNEAWLSFGTKGHFYAFEDIPNDTYATKNSFDGTKAMSAQPSGSEQFDERLGSARRLKVCMHSNYCRNGCSSPIVDVTVRSNLNLMDFYSECPKWFLDGMDYTDWHTYARSSMSPDMKKQLYPALKQAIAGKTKAEAANVLMKFVEGFPYGYDSEIWGYDRAFFPDETIYYPKRDCEDGAILFTRVVRDLLSLPVALVYYPGHLAAAVAFDSDVKGAYIMRDGKKYTICDPTYYYVNVGVQMPTSAVDPTKAVLIPIP